MFEADLAIAHHQFLIGVFVGCPFEFGQTVPRTVEVSNIHYIERDPAAS